MTGKKLWGIIIVCVCVAGFLYSLYALYQLQQAQSMLNAFGGMYGGKPNFLDSEISKSKFLYIAGAVVAAVGAYWGTKLVNEKS